MFSIHFELEFWSTLLCRFHINYGIRYFSSKIISSDTIWVIWDAIICFVRCKHLKYMWQSVHTNLCNNRNLFWFMKKFVSCKPMAFFEAKRKCIFLYLPIRLQLQYTWASNCFIRKRLTMWAYAFPMFELQS